MKTLYLNHSQDMMGEPIIEFYATDKAFYELSEDDEYETYLGQIDNKDGEEMEKMGFDCGTEEDCIKYAKEVKKIPIPEVYKLEISNY